MGGRTWSRPRARCTGTRASCVYLGTEVLAPDTAAPIVRAYGENLFRVTLPDGVTPVVVCAIDAAGNEGCAAP